MNHQVIVTTQSITTLGLWDERIKGGYNSKRNDILESVLDPKPEPKFSKFGCINAMSSMVAQTLKRLGKPFFDAAPT
jgi:hypothetical protein